MFSNLPNLTGAFQEERRTGRPRMVPVNDSLFARPLSVDAAYWLGFILADGSVVWKPYWSLIIDLQARDESHLRDLQAILGGTLKVKGNVVRLSAHSKRLCERLAWLGVVPRKSYSPVQPPFLSDDKENVALLRGLFDGDGCLHVSKRGYLQAAFCGHPDLVCWFVSAVGVQGSSRLRGSTLYAQWSGGKQARAVAEFLYSSPGPALQRKAEIAKRFFL